MAIIKKKRKPGPDMTMKMMGGEPVVKTPSELGPALTWFAYGATPDLKRQWIGGFMQKNGYTKQDIDAVQAKIRHVPTTMCSLARLLINGSKIEPRYAEELNERLKTFLAGKHVDLDADGVPIILDKNISVAAKIEQSAQKYTFMVDQAMDMYISAREFPEELFQKMRAAGLGQSHAHIVNKYIEPIIGEMQMALSGEHPDLAEAYEGYGKKGLIGFIANLNQLRSDLSGLIAMKRVTRKPRKARAPSVEKLVKRLNYMKEFPELSIASLAPEKIIGASELWVYNTKIRRLGVYIADGGLSLKGSTIKNFTEASVDKKVRKPESVIPAVFQGTKAAVNKMFSAIKCADRKLTGRINKDTILLRVF